MKKSVALARKLNKEKGGFFFSPNTQRFFKSKVVSKIIKDDYFITSTTQILHDCTERTTYNACIVNWETGDIEVLIPTPGQTRFASKNAARTYIYAHWFGRHASELMKSVSENISSALDWGREIDIMTEAARECLDHLNHDVLDYTGAIEHLAHASESARALSDLLAVTWTKLAYASGNKDYVPTRLKGPTSHVSPR